MQHFAVIITTLHPGYLAHNPTYQQDMHVLPALLCCGGLVVSEIFKLDPITYKKVCD